MQNNVKRQVTINLIQIIIIDVLIHKQIIQFTIITDLLNVILPQDVIYDNTRYFLILFIYNKSKLSVVMEPKQSKTLNQSFNILNSFDFSSINEMDPSLSEGFKIIYQRELPFEIKILQKEGVMQTLPNNQILRVKILLQGQQKAPTCLKIQLTSDSDLYFNFFQSTNEQSFKFIKQKQNFYIDFKDYPTVILKNFLKTQRESNSYILIFTIFSDNQGKLQIIQRTQFKNYQILAFDCRKSSDEFIKRVISYRYLAMKSKLALMEGRLYDINDLVRVKNPGLLLQIQKKMPNFTRKKQ